MYEDSQRLSDAAHTHKHTHTRHRAMASKLVQRPVITYTVRQREQLTQLWFGDEPESDSFHYDDTVSIKTVVGFHHCFTWNRDEKSERTLL